jgi:hypothetical protein
MSLYGLVRKDTRWAIFSLKSVEELAKKKKEEKLQRMLEKNPGAGEPGSVRARIRRNGRPIRSRHAGMKA